jgi:hypothetical protein
MVHDLLQIVLVNHHVAVADQYVGMTAFSIGRDEVVDLGVESGIAFLHHDGYVPVRVLVPNFFSHLVGRIVEILEAEDYFVCSIVLGAEACEVVEKVVVKPPERLQDRDRAQGTRRGG